MTSSKGSTKAIRSYQRAVLIYNPNAGKLRRDAGYIPQALAVLREQGHAVTSAATSGPGDATAIAARSIAEGADLILVAGGDGSINEALNGMIGSHIPLGVLPGGTANVLASETGLKRSHAASMVKDLEPVRLAVGLVRNPDGSPRRHFICMAGAGLDAHVVAKVKGPIKRMFGKGAYWVAGFQSLSRRLEEMDAQFNDVHIRCSFALLSRVRNYGGDLEIVLNAGLLHNQLGAYLFEGSNSFRYLKYFTGVMLRSAAGMSGITATHIDKLSLSPVSAPVRLQVDGEDAGFLPVTVEIVPDALTILLPPAYLARERKRWTT